MTSYLPHVINIGTYTSNVTSFSHVYSRQMSNPCPHDYDPTVLPTVLATRELQDCVAQLAGRSLPTPEVCGSNPVVS